MLNARNIIQMSIEEVWDLPDGPMKLKFDDEIVDTSTRAVIFSRYIWDIHKLHTGTPVLARHLLSDKTTVGKNTHLDLLSRVMWDCYDAYDYVGILIDMEEMSKLAYEITNRMYNDFTRKLEPYVTSLSYLDFLDVIEDPTIKAAHDALRAEVQPTQSGIDHVHSVIKKVLLDPNKLKGNAVSYAAKSGLVPMQQIVQCVGPRGPATDIDSHIFRRPIVDGFAHCITNLQDSMTESRSAAKALFFTKDPMRQSEYFNRNLQLSAATLKNLHMVDCGSTEYVPFPVRPADLRDIVGIYYWDDKDKRLKSVKKNDTALIGQTINIRTVFTCKHPDRYGICVKCFGELGLSVPRNTNIGHLSASELLSEVAQRILSTKHEDGGASVDDLELTDYDQNFIVLGDNPNNIYLSPTIVTKGLRLSFSSEEAKNLHDLSYVTGDVRVLTPTRVSELTAVCFQVPVGTGYAESMISVSNTMRSSSLSLEMLQYIKDNGWTMTEDGNYIVDLSKWNKTKPILILPMKHFSTVDFMHLIGSMIKGTSRKGSKALKTHDSMVMSLIALHDTVNSKLQVNLSHLQTIILTMLIQSEEDNDYRLPMPRSEGTFGKYNQIMEMRSQGPGMAFQNQTDMIFSPESFVVKVRPPHPLDDLLMG